MRAAILTLALLLLAACQYPEVRRPAEADTAPAGDAEDAAATGAPTPDAPAAPAEQTEPTAETDPTEQGTGAQTSAPETAAETIEPQQAPPEPEPATRAPSEAQAESTPTASAPATEPTAETRVLSGRVTIADMRGADVTPEQAYSQTVVYYHPNEPVAAPEPGTYSINTQSKRFNPDVLVVPVGSTVRFPNDDRILHNVFSLSPIAEFDLGFYGFNEARDHSFDEPGLALIHCNVHQSMQAEVLVVDTPFFGKVDASGRFRFAGVPDSGGTLHVWNPRSGEKQLEIQDAAAAEPVIAIELTRPRVDDHVNKFGESY